MRRQTDFMKLVKQSACFYNHMTLDSSKITNETEILSLKPKCIKKHKMISMLNAFHKEHLHNKLLQTEYSSIINLNSINNSNSAKKRPQFFITKTNIDVNSASLCKKEDKSHPHSLQYKTSFYPICTDEYRLYSNSKLREESIKQFMQKTGVIAKAKYFLNIQKEIQKGLFESSEVKIQGEVAKRKGLIWNKKLLDIYSDNFAYYIKILNEEVEKEKTIIKELETQHEILSNQIKTIKDKINSYKKQLVTGKEYKKFILLVKHHVTKISQLPLEVFVKHFGNDYCSRKPSCSPRMGKQRKSVRFNHRKSDIRLLSNMEDLKRYTQPATDFQSGGNNITEKEIFSTPEEFDNEYKEVEEKVLKLFIVLSDKKRELVCLKQQRNDLLLNKLTQEKIENDNIEEKEKMLRMIKQKHMMLLNEFESGKQVLIEDTIKKTIKQKLQLMLLNIPINIEKDLDFPFAYEHIKTKNNILLVFGNKVNPTVYYLELLERILLVFLEKIALLKRNPKIAVDYYKIKNALEIKKRILNSRLKIKAEKERRELMNEKILEKTNKLLYLPYRKTNVTLCNIKQIQTMKSKKKNKNEIDDLSFNDVIYYD